MNESDTMAGLQEALVRLLKSLKKYPFSIID